MTKKHKRQHRETEEAEDTPKPLKLVLKVGSHGTPVPSPGSVIDDADTPDKKHKHKKRKKHKDKKERRRREKGEDDDAESEGEEDTSQMAEGEPPEPPEARLSEQEESDNNEDPTFTKPRVSTPSYTEVTPARSLRERKSDGEKRALNYLLDYLHKILSRKDVNGFFQFPVTDQIAPRYSEIIQHPMDFSTIRTKIDHSEYTNVGQYKADFRLMLENCMAYNHPDTIFHKEAQRLLNIGIKQLSKEKLITLKRSLPNLTELTEEELDLKDDSGDDLVNCVEYKNPRKSQMDKYEAIVDDGSPEEILAQVQAAARNAAAELHERNPNGKMGYLTIKKDNTTYLNFLNPDNDGIVSETERVVNIGGLMEKIKMGTGSLAGFREDKRNRAIPLSYLTYGPFSSYAPVFDSTTANLSKEESDLLLTTYGDESGTQYSKSIQNFVENSGDYSIQMVDNLLGILTAGKHSKTKQYFNQKEKQVDDEKPKQQQKAPAPDTNNTKDMESLRSLTKLGIDMSFLDSMDKSTQNDDQGSKEVQDQLNRTSQLLSNLNSAQHQRLSTQPPTHLAHVQGPNDKEMTIAEKLRDGLTGLTKQVTPSDVTSTGALHKAMGVKVPQNNNGTPRASDDMGSDPTADINNGQAGDNESLSFTAGDNLGETVQYTDNVNPVETGIYQQDESRGRLQQFDLQGQSTVDEGQGQFLQLEQEAQQQQQASMMDNIQMQIPEMVGDSNDMAMPSSVTDNNSLDQLVNAAQFSENSYAGPVSAGSTSLEGFDMSNGMDTSETEAAVANILG